MLHFTDPEARGAQRSGDLRSANMEARRRRIVAAAAAIIEREGMEALSMRKLATEAGVSVTTLYNLFGSRTDILFALVHDLTDRIDRILDAEAPLDDPIQRCRAIVSVSIDYMVEHQSTFRPMMLALQRGLPDLPADRFGMPERAAGMQSVAIEAAVARGLLVGTLAADVLASQIYHGYEMACLLWSRGLYDAEQFKVRALYGLYVALLAVATPTTRGPFENELRNLESFLQSRASSESAAVRPVPSSGNQRTGS